MFKVDFRYVIGAIAILIMGLGFTIHYSAEILSDLRLDTDNQLWGISLIILLVLAGPILSLGLAILELLAGLTIFARF